MPNLSDHDLKQMDPAWQAGRPEPVVRGLLKRALDDLRVARDRLNQRPDNSLRPPGTMAPNSVACRLLAGKVWSPTHFAVQRDLQELNRRPRHTMVGGWALPQSLHATLVAARMPP